MTHSEKLLFELSREGREGVSFADETFKEEEKAPLGLDGALLRDDIENFPELSEVDVVRHYTRLSKWNTSIDEGMYPLGSCTMKYNPKLHEDAARLPGFVNLHPCQHDSDIQGALGLVWKLERYLCAVTGMDAAALQLAAGSHGEFTGLLIARAHFDHRGEQRTEVLIPDSAHGTNPASATLAGYESVEIPSDETGRIDLAEFKKKLTPSVAALMMTNPNTLGIFESDVVEIAELLHQNGSLLYCDGANMNAFLGRHRPGDAGVDIIHLNLHKTFSTPHGGGGPGGGCVAVKRFLEPCLPVPRIRRNEEGYYRFDRDRPRSIGRMRSFCGNFGVLVRAYAYLRTLGHEGLREVSGNAVLNANYLRAKLKDDYELPYETPSLHEVVFSDARQREHDVSALDVAKRLLDLGFHPPTVFFPLIVKGALMIEPTETEGTEELDRFVAAMKQIAREAEENPEILREAPVRMPVRRLDEVRAARKLRLRWTPEEA
ncbi:MAG: aminomethyl-transferring glycine dehydrogenase subunit GcvPB [Acidobacteriota bacterium]|nr:MAG: aminomethyl-transferring glycine dehydrogenase subunit GcvPB [Acidobacteriota bacterium]